MKTFFAGMAYQALLTAFWIWVGWNKPSNIIKDSLVDFVAILTIIGAIWLIQRYKIVRRKDA